MRSMLYLRASGIRGSGRNFERRAGFVMIRAHPFLLLIAVTIFALCVLGAGLAGFSYGERVSVRGEDLQPVTVTAAGQAGPAPSSEGPWGQVECERVVIEPPPDCLPPDVQSGQSPRWFFKGCSAAQLQQLLEDLSPADSVISGLLRTNEWEIRSSGVLIRPSPKTILALSPASRKHLYEELGKHPENSAQTQPFHWRAADQDALFRNSGMSATTRNLLQALCYRHGDLVMFADLPVLLQTLPTQTERSAVRRAVSRQFGILLRLDLNHETDINSLVRYWGTGGMAKTFRPVLEAASRTEAGRRIPVLGLLPPAMRGRLYTFPTSSPASELDAFWTAANFFETDPRPAKVDKLDWLRRCQTEYHPLDSDPRFGDVLMLTRADGRLLHSCVYLADDVVYTKNGPGRSNPWMLLKVQDLLTHFAAGVPESEHLRVTYIRANNT